MSVFVLNKKKKEIANTFSENQSISEMKTAASIHFFESKDLG